MLKEEASKSQSAQEQEQGKSRVRKGYQQSRPAGTASVLTVPSRGGKGGLSERSGAAAASGGAVGGAGGEGAAGTMEGGSVESGTKVGKPTEGVTAGQASRRQSAAAKERETYVCEAVRWLRGVGGHVAALGHPVCWECILETLCVSSDYIFKKNASGESRVQRLEACSRRMKEGRGWVDGKTIRDLHEDAGFGCCPQGCFKGLPLSVMERVWRDFIDAGSIRAENLVLLNVLWHEGTGRPAELCPASIKAWLGVDWRRCKPLLAIARGCVSADVAIEARQSSHGLKLWRQVHAPPNSLPTHLVKEIHDLLDVEVKFSPEVNKSGRCFGKLTDPRCKGLRALFEREWGGREDAERGESFSFATFHRVAEKWAKDKGIDEILRMAADHNVCAVCKELEDTIGCLYREERAAAKAGKEELRQVLETKHKAFEARLEAHLHKDIEIRRHISRLRDLAKALHDREVERGGPGGMRQDHPFNSRDLIYMLHVDDMTALNEPHVPRQAQEGLEKFRRNVNGQYDLVRDILVSYLPELGAGSKDSSGVIDEILLNLLEHTNGERVLVLVFDCGPLNYRPQIAMALAQALVDMGWFSFVQIIYFSQYHGKWKADQIFGVWQRKLQSTAIFGLDSLARMAESIGGGTHRSRIVNHRGMSDYESFFTGRYQVSIWWSLLASIQHPDVVYIYYIYIIYIYIIYIYIKYM
jgi:hypothetical protein